MPTIVSTIWRRLEYTKRCYDAISRCIGIEKYNILIYAEPGYKEVLDLAINYKFPCPSRITVNKKRLGCNGNIYQALDAAFKEDDYVIMVEDDIILACDALLYFEQCGKQYQKDTSVFTVTGYIKNTLPPKDMHYSMHKLSWFTPWGWATWANRWAEIKPILCPNGKIVMNPSWDIIVNHHVRKDRSEIQPFLARTQNVGALLGAYCPGSEWHIKNCFNPVGAWSVPIKIIPFTESTK